MRYICLQADPPLTLTHTHLVYVSTYYKTGPIQNLMAVENVLYLQLLRLPKKPGNSLSFNLDVLILLFSQSWDAYFRNAQATASPGETEERRPSSLLQGRGMSQTPAMSQKVVEDHLAVHTLIRAYQVRSAFLSVLVASYYSVII